MALPGLDAPARAMFRGNLLLAVCCAFYLAWWLLAFRPGGAVRGIRTGWLLLPALAAGIGAVVLALRGVRASPMARALFPGWLPLWGGLAAYLILLAITVLLLKRPLTTELFLIVGWDALTLAEINALYGAGRFSHRAAVLFALTAAAATAVSLVCYVLYYRLGPRAGYLDGMVPLLAAALVSAALCAGIAA